MRRYYDCIASDGDRDFGKASGGEFFEHVEKFARPKSLGDRSTFDCDRNMSNGDLDCDLTTSKGDHW